MKRIWHYVLGLAAFVPMAALAADGPTTRPATFTIPGSTVQFTLVRVPGGEVDITAGDEVKHAKFGPFWIAEKELTWDEYDVWYQKFDLKTEAEKIAVIGVTRTSNPYMDPTLGFGHDGFPAINVAAHSADMYCDWLSKKLGKKFRVATEGEWEWACRAGQTPRTFSPAELDPVAWYRDNSQNDAGDPAPHAAGAKRPNAWGLYDMLGNVGEWTAGIDGQPVVKGGTYRDPARLVQSTARAPYNPNWQMRDPQMPKSVWWLSDGPHVGFRIVMEEP